MIHDLDASLHQLFRQLARSGSALEQAAISFETPDPEWRGGLEVLTLNCYLYRIHENPRLRRAEPVAERSGGEPGGDNGTPTHGRRRAPPVPIDCTYCLTAWSAASDDTAAEEHLLLSEVLEALLRHRVRPPQQLWGALDDPVTPYPVVSTFAEDLSTPGEFWTALEHPVKPSLNCVLSIAVEPDGGDRAEPVDLVDEVSVVVHPVVAAGPGRAPSRHNR